MNRKKKTERIAKPLAARAYGEWVSVHPNKEMLEETDNNSVIPGEDSKLIQTGNQIPPGCDVAGYEDPKGQDRKGVHELAAIAGALLFGDSAH
jgi:hypothetical protein